MAGFTYQPLRFRNYDIRLLEILPEPSLDYESTVRCRMIHVSLIDQEDQYHALSYHWEGSSPSSKIQIDGHDFYIRPGLETALREIRRHQMCSRIWIDAICINQADENEREFQMTRIGLIYERAISTLAWLGNPDDHSQHAIDALNHLDIYSKGTPKAVWTNIEMAKRHPGLLSISKLFKRPYWWRKWILQELAKSRSVNIICGKSCISLETLLRLCNENLGQEFLPSEVLDLLRGIAILRRQEVSNDVHMPVEKIMYLSRHSLATKAHDFIYAVLPMASDRDKVLRTPNYTQSAQDVFTEVSWKIMATQSKMNLILLSRRNPKENYNLPSWVPDWSSLPKQIPPWISGSLFQTLQGQPNSERPKNFLHVEGTLIERIGAVAESSKCDFTPLSGADRFWTYREPKTQSLDDRNQDWTVADVLASLWDNVMLAVPVKKTSNVQNQEVSHEREKHEAFLWNMTVDQKALAVAFCFRQDDFSNDHNLTHHFYSSVKDLSFCEHTINDWIELYMIMKLNPKAVFTESELDFASKSDSGYESMMEGPQKSSHGYCIERQRMEDLYHKETTLVPTTFQQLTEEEKNEGICFSAAALSPTTNAKWSRATCSNSCPILQQGTKRKIPGHDSQTRSTKRTRLCGPNRALNISETAKELTAAELDTARNVFKQALGQMRKYQMTLVVTNHGNFRIAYDKARVGDFICRIQHCSLPVVLRRERSRRLPSNIEVTAKSKEPSLGDCFGYVGEVIEADPRIEGWTKDNCDVREVRQFVIF